MHSDTQGRHEPQGVSPTPLSPDPTAQRTGTYNVHRSYQRDTMSESIKEWR